MDTVQEVMAISHPLGAPSSQQLSNSTQQTSWQVEWLDKKGRTCIAPIRTRVKIDVFFQVAFTGS